MCITKKIFTRLFVLAVAVLLVFSGCARRQEDKTADMNETRRVANPAAPIVVPEMKDRMSSNWMELRFERSYTVDELFAKAEAIALVRITSWLGEDLDMRTTFSEADVLRCYRGNLPERITLAQLGTSQVIAGGTPIYTRGNEFLVFLYEDTRFPDKKNVFSTINEGETLFDVLRYDGEDYLIPRAEYLLLNSSEKEHLKVITDEEFCKKLTVALLESDPIWKSENGFFNRKVTVALKLTEMEKIINAPG